MSVRPSVCVFYLENGSTNFDQISVIRLGRIRRTVNLNDKTACVFEHRRVLTVCMRKFIITWHQHFVSEVTFFFCVTENPLVDNGHFALQVVSSRAWRTPPTTHSNRFQPFHDSSRQQHGVTVTRCCSYSCFLLLKMGDSDVRNM